MTFSQTLLNWYDENKRPLPWRENCIPYRIWLSEIMLQQTQTETVKGYYARFLDCFPTVFDLANADEDTVLKLWEGLGYYSRARNLHKAAKMVAANMNGVFPGNAEGLRTLPGVGPYAANAIASIAYGECVPALDGNQARVISRILAYEDVIKTPFDLRAQAMELISRERPGDYNQALMDLGAGICTPKRPKCAECPVSAFCAAFKNDASEDFPKKAPPIPKREQDMCVVIAIYNGKFLLRKRPKGLLGGLYEFCLLEGHHSPAELAEHLKNAGFGTSKVIASFPDSKHVFTHLIWRMKGYHAEVTAVPEGFIAVSPSNLDRYAFPSAIRVYRECAGDMHC
ncbi:MAG: A/G-specific adenine glycosylase [Clostridia bacterium]|nr:A/G-specific adenine glycosylase [Clostridia bacterium]